MNATYHLALIKGSGPCYPLHRNGHRTSTLVLQAERSLDDLSPSCWQYLGEREVTKAHLRRHADEILAQVNRTEGTTFTRLLVP